MTRIPENPLILIDGSWYLYRAFNAFPADMSNGTIPTNAIYGSVRMIRGLLRRVASDRVAVVFDAKGKNFRDDLYSEYKSHRSSMPRELSCQIEPLHDIIQAMGLPLLIIEGVEADDVIGTLACRASRENIPVLISTGDKDMAQLVDENVILINTMTNTITDREGVVDRFGISSELITDYLALLGDRSDNIPGVPGIGKKTAVALLRGIGGLDIIFERLDRIATLGFSRSKSIARKMKENKERAILSYNLAKIKVDVELNLRLEDLTKGKPRTDLLTRLYEQLMFNSWLSEELQRGNDRPTDESMRATSSRSSSKAERASFPGSVAATKVSSKVQNDHDRYEVVTDQEKFDQWLEILSSTKVFALSTKTDNADCMAANLVGISFATTSGRAMYLPIEHDYLNAPPQLDRNSVLDKLRQFLEDPSKNKVGRNLKLDMSILSRYGIHLRGIKHDTMLASYVYNSTGGKHDVEGLALRFLKYRCISLENLVGKGKKRVEFNQLEVKTAGEYAAEDTDITMRLYQHLYSKIEKDSSLKSIYETIEMPLIPVLSRMECTGVMVDAGRLKVQSEKIAGRLIELESEAYRLAGVEFNLRSHKQTQAILFERMALPTAKRTQSGLPSTDEEVLRGLALSYPLPKVILEYRALAKLKSTYTDKIPEMINKVTGRVHTSYHQAVTATGRLSSTSPNLQNIPSRSEYGHCIRQAFIAPKRWKIIAIDYSQIELRIMAHLSKDKALIRAFRQGKDIHAATASEVLGISIRDISSEQRRRAKVINFGLIYGMSAFGLAKQLGTPRHEAQDYMNIYFKRYPGITRYLEKTKSAAREKGYVETLFGRRLQLPTIRSSNSTHRKAAERAAINAPMQGTAADIIKKAMLLVDDWIEKQGNGQVKLLMQVHDELVFEVDEISVARVGYEIKGLMESSANLDVPLVADIGHGNNWDQTQ